jgi:ribosomal protein S27AE
MASFCERSNEPSGCTKAGNFLIVLITATCCMSCGVGGVVISKHLTRWQCAMCADGAYIITPVYWWSLYHQPCALMEPISSPCVLMESISSTVSADGADIITRVCWWSLYHHPVCWWSLYYHPCVLMESISSPVCADGAISSPVCPDGVYIITQSPSWRSQYDDSGIRNSKYVMYRNSWDFIWKIFLNNTANAEHSVLNDALSKRVTHCVWKPYVSKTHNNTAVNTKHSISYVLNHLYSTLILNPLELL